MHIGQRSDGEVQALRGGLGGLLRASVGGGVDGADALPLQAHRGRGGLPAPGVGQAVVDVIGVPVTDKDNGPFRSPPAAPRGMVLWVPDDWPALIVSDPPGSVNAEKGKRPAETVCSAVA